MCGHVQLGAHCFTCKAGISHAQTHRHDCSSINTEFQHSFAQSVLPSFSRMSCALPLSSLPYHQQTSQGNPYYKNSITLSSVCCLLSFNQLFSHSMTLLLSLLISGVITLQDFVNFGNPHDYGNQITFIHMTVNPSKDLKKSFKSRICLSKSHSDSSQADYIYSGSH